MTDKATDSGRKSQSDKFKDAAREAECDENEKRWEERLRKVAKHGHEPAPPPRDPVMKKLAKQKPTDPRAS